MRRAQKGAGSDVFEIKDFSVSTPWEAFVVALEEAVRAWLDGRVWLATKEHPQLLPCIEHELEQEGGQRYVLSLHGNPHVARTTSRTSGTAIELPRFMVEMLDPSSDFSSESFSTDTSERLRRWFGLHAFIVLTPRDVPVLDAREMTLMQSALCVALTSCERPDLPCFVLHDVTEAHVYGRALAAWPTLGCRFDVELLKASEVPDACRTIAGLVALFRSKLQLSGAAAANASAATTSSAAALGTAMAAGAITLARRSTYVLGSWSKWQRPSIGPEDLLLTLGGASDPLEDPRGEAALALSVQWPCTIVDTLGLGKDGWPPPDEALRRGSALETALLDPESAPLWLVRAAPLAVRSAGAIAPPAASAEPRSAPSRTPSSIPAANIVKPPPPPAVPPSRRIAELSASVGAMLESWAALDEHVGTLVARGFPNQERGLPNKELSDGEGGALAMDTWLGAVRATGGALPSAEELARLVETIISEQAAPHQVAALTSDATAAAASSAAGGTFVCSGAPYGSLWHRLGLTALRARASWRAAHAPGVLLEGWRVLLRRLREQSESAMPLPHLPACRAPEAGMVGVQQQAQLLAMCIALQRGETVDGYSGAGASTGGSPGRLSARKARAVVRRTMLGLTADDDNNEDEDEEEEEFLDSVDRPAVHLKARRWSRDSDEDHAASLRNAGAAAGAMLRGVFRSAGAAAGASSSSAHLSWAEAAVERVGARRPIEGLVGLRSQLQLWEPHLQVDPLAALRQQGAASAAGAAAAADGVSDRKGGCGGSASTLVRRARDATRTKSEMQAFKAANPHAVLEDFVRWRLPTEWLVSEDVEGGAFCPREAPPSATDGQLSELLRSPSSMYQVLWGATEPLAAEEQRPIFNAEGHALEALEALEALTPAQLLPQLVYLSVEAVLGALGTSPLLQLPPAAPSALRALADTTRSLLESQAPPRAWLQAVLPPLEALELQLSQAASLEAKLTDQPEVVRALLADPCLKSEVLVPPAGRAALLEHLKRAAGPRLAVAAPDMRELVLRATCARPSAADAIPTAQRMYVALQDRGDVRLAISLGVHLDASPDA